MPPWPSGSTILKRPSSTSPMSVSTPGWVTTPVTCSSSESSVWDIGLWTQRYTSPGRVHQQLTLDRPIPESQPLVRPRVKGALEPRISREHRLPPTAPLRQRVSELEVERL